MKCQRCGEEIKKLALPMTHFNGSDVEVHYYHLECHARGITGGLNHLKKTCHCYGGKDEPDPPEMTKRQAALAAYEYFTTMSLKP